MIETGRLHLIPSSIELLQSILAGSDELYSKFKIRLPSPYTEFPGSLEYLINRLNENPSMPPFQSYSIISKESPAYLGQIGFINAPDKNGESEFGYEIAQDFRGKGYATEAVQAMIQLAFGVPVVKSIIAHTLNEKNASNFILIKNNFIFDRAITGTEDGTIWKWVLPRKVFEIKQMFV